jgi:ABC-type phosphate transport system auxiliary subunit
MERMTKEGMENWVTNAHAIRGQIIAEFCRLEYAIVHTMVDFFTKDEETNSDLIQVVFDRLTFEEKRQSLHTMLQREQDKIELDKKHLYSKLMSEVQSLISYRNQFAHYPLISFVDPYETSVISITKYKDGIKQIEYSKADIDELITRIRKAHDDIFFIHL